MMRATARTPTARASSRRSAALPLALACLVVLAFFSGAYATREFRVPWGDDTFFYVDAVRTAGSEGLADDHLLARPAFPLLSASLIEVLGATPWTGAVAISFAMAAGLALAGGAIAARWGLRRWVLGGYVALGGLTVVSVRLAASKQENLMTLWLMAAAIAVLLAAPGSRAGLASSAALLAGAGLTEWPFLVPFAAVVLAAMAWSRFVGSSAGLATITNGDRADLLRSLLVATLVAGALTAVVVVGLNGTGVRDAIQYLPPGYRYRGRFFGELRLAAPVPTVVVIAAGWVAAMRVTGGDASHLRPAIRLFGTWSVLIAGVLLLGLFGLQLPTYRALTFGLPIMLAMAAAPLIPFVLRDGKGALRSVLVWFHHRPLMRVATATILAALVVVPAALVWYRWLDPSVDPKQLGQIRGVAAYAAAVDRPVVLVIELPDPVRALFFRRIVAAAVGRPEPPIIVVPGRPEDVLAGRPTLSGDPRRDSVAVPLFEDARPALRAGAAVVVGATLDPAAFRTAVADGRPTFGGVAVLRGPPPPPTLDAGASGPFVPLPPWWVTLLHAAAALAIMASAGIGLSVLALGGGREPRLGPTQLALAPAFGGLSVAFLAMAFERAGFTPAEGAGPAVVGLAIGVSLSVLVWPRLRRGRGHRVRAEGPDVLGNGRGPGPGSR